MDNKKEQGSPEHLDKKTNEQIDKIWKDAEESITKMRKEGKYALGQKLPASMKPFNRQEMETKEFSAKHSSVLRILTKWAEYLEEIFEEPEQYVKKRLYPFVTIHN